MTGDDRKHLQWSESLKAMSRLASALVLALVANVFHLQTSWAQWRPSYQPTEATYVVRNDIFNLVLEYTNWQGYFENTYTVPAGGHDFPFLHACAQRQCLTELGGLGASAYPYRGMRRRFMHLQGTLSWT